MAIKDLPKYLKFLLPPPITEYVSTLGVTRAATTRVLAPPSLEYRPLLPWAASSSFLGRSSSSVRWR